MEHRQNDGDIETDALMSRSHQFIMNAADNDFSNERLGEPVVGSRTVSQKRFMGAFGYGACLLLMAILILSVVLIMSPPLLKRNELSDIDVGMGEQKPMSDDMEVFATNLDDDRNDTPSDDFFAEDSTHEEPKETGIQTWTNYSYANDVTGLNWYQSAKNIRSLLRDCEMMFKNYSSLTPEKQDLLRANCGANYSLPKPRAVRVALYGSSWEQYTFLKLSGCGTAFHCDVNRKCVFHITQQRSKAADSDVIVVTSYEHRLLQSFHQKGQYGRNPFRVLYWREAYWRNGPPLQFQRQNVDMTMGIHLQAELQNPPFRIYPSLMAKGVFHDAGMAKEGFAVSLISDCETLSMRNVLLNQLENLLGKERVDRFGACSGRSLPGSTIHSASKFLAKYRFFLAFENTIQKGYVTEKLFWALLLPLIPVYYGDSNVPNITTTPSFLKVLDYSTTRSLAEHMLFLANDNHEYAKYAVWRTAAKPFTTEFLDDTAENFPGPAEVLQNIFRPSPFLSNRKAVCCRLCNVDFLESKVARRSESNLIPHSTRSDQSLAILTKMKGE